MPQDQSITSVSTIYQQPWSKTSFSEQRKLAPILLLSALAAIIFAVYEPLMVSLGLAITLYLFMRYISQLGTTIPILELIMLMAALQWVLGAYISYRIDYEHWKYFMYVEKDAYFELVVPGLVAFITGMFALQKKYVFSVIDRKIGSIVEENPKIPYYLLILGFVGPIIFSFLPSVFAFVGFIIANFKYIGAALLLFNQKSKNKWTVFLLVMGFTLVISIAQGMFHDLLLWAALLISFVVLQYRLNFLQKLLLTFIGFLFAFLIQSVKGEYRASSIVTDSNTEKLGLFYVLVEQRINNMDEYLTETFFGETNVRFNQGWIISAVLHNVPKNEPFAKGETIGTAITASLVPRFLNPDKKEAGGQENFERFTGLYLGDYTSMGTSVIGEAYANYGKVGSWVFMLIYGLFLSGSFSLLVKYGEKHPIIFVFLPLIFLQVIKAETELVVVLNHLVKSSLFVLLFLWFARKYWNWKI